MSTLNQSEHAYSPARSPASKRTIIVSSGSDSDEVGAGPSPTSYPSTPLRAIGRCISWSNMDAGMSLSLDEEDEPKNCKTPKATPKRAASSKVLADKGNKKVGSKKLSDLSSPSLSSETIEQKAMRKATTTPKKIKARAAIDQALIIDATLMGDVDCSTPTTSTRIIKKMSSRSMESSSTDSSSSEKARARSKSPFHRVVHKLSIRKSKRSSNSSDDEMSSADFDQSSNWDDASVASDMRSQSSPGSTSRGRSRGRSIDKRPVQTVLQSVSSSPGASLYKSNNSAYPVSPHRSNDQLSDGRVSPRRTSSALVHPRTPESSSYSSPRRATSNSSILKHSTPNSKGFKTPTYSSPAKKSLSDAHKPTSILKTPSSILKTPSYSTPRHVDNNVSPGMVDDLVRIIQEDDDSEHASGTTTERTKYLSVKECLGEYEKIVSGEVA